MWNTVIPVWELSETCDGSHDTNICWIDCRAQLVDPAAGRLAYENGHIPGAFFMDLESDLSGHKTGSNGRHPLPDPAQLAQTLLGQGIGPDTQVIAYDDNGGAFAARLWWLLRWLGHEKVAVLDGGIQAWLQAGRPLSREVPTPPGGGSLSEVPVLPVVTADELQRLLSGSQVMLIDARSPDRYSGENETVDPVAGHIPGARNRFFGLNLQSDGRFKPREQLRTEFLTILSEKPAGSVVHQCGSGVTACHNMLAMEIAGLEAGMLYPGSWSEWCSDSNRPVTVGNQN